MNGLIVGTLGFEIVQLAKIALLDDIKQTQAYIRRLCRSLRRAEPNVAASLQEVVESEIGGRSAPSTRSAAPAMLPVDRETRHDLVRFERIGFMRSEPKLRPDIRDQIEQVIAERTAGDRLAAADLEPSRTVLFTGAPGVGKTLTARWIAHKLGKPLFTLDLSAVMSSFLGKTGNNIKEVLNFAKANDGVLLLDEFDAIAKRRDDEGDVGELKRLVTVLLQEIDVWPSSSLLIAATNHGDLLDPAIWRRFDCVVAFPSPDVDDIYEVVATEFGEMMKPELVRAFAVVQKGMSYSDAVRSVRALQRRALLAGGAIEDVVIEAVRQSLERMSKADLKVLGVHLEAAGISQRQISEMTGLSRDTLRRARS